jgi:hypothetical protein
MNSITDVIGLCVGIIGAETIGLLLLDIFVYKK